jgi:hypothetical protein
MIESTSTVAPLPPLQALKCNIRILQAQPRDIVVTLLKVVPWTSCAPLVCRQALAFSIVGAGSEPLAGIDGVTMLLGKDSCATPIYNLGPVAI